MTIRKQRFEQGVELTPANIEGIGGTDLTREGEIDVDSSDDRLKVRVESATRTVVTEDQTQTLTNKTIDANGTGNSISNLETADLASGVLNTSTTLTGASDTQIPSALAVKTYVDTGLAAQNQASEISYNNATSGLTATEVQSAIDEVEGRVDTVESSLSAHISDSVDAHDASAISNIPSGNLAATDVQSALNELQSDIDSSNSSISNHITDTVDAHDASAISVSPSGNLSSTEVQSALVELQGDIDTNASNLSAHLSDSVDAHDASAISSVASGNLAATDVQGALNELQSDIDTRALATDLSNHISDSVDAHDASAISNTPAGNIAATDVQAAINELDSEKAKLAGDLAQAFSVLRLEEATATDSATTGSNASLSSFTQGIIRLTNASLVSLANIPAGNQGQQLEIFNRTGATITVVDESGAVGTAANRIYTGSGQNITLANNASLLFAYDSTSSRWQTIGGSGGGSGSATSAVDNVFNINDATDATKQINFDAGGTTSTKTTIAASQTANRTVTLPDATTTIVGTDVAQTLTNKTIVAANNTITTAASANLTSTELNGALAELQADIETRGYSPDLLAAQTFDTASLSNFTQTGLSLTVTNVIKGEKSALLTHQAASTQSFKQVIGVARKFRGYAQTLSLSVRSSAAAANLTLLVTDETNAATLLASSQITTGQITSAVFNTNSNTTVNVTSNSILNQIKVGATITGSGIPAGTVVTAVNGTSITISQSATATATGVSLKVSLLPATQRFSFTIPANCSSISYTVTALAEAGSPESYIDDIQIYLAQTAASSASVTTTTFNATDWAPYTPTFTGFGTPSAVEFEYRQVGANYEVRGKFTSGTSTATEARISLPVGATSAGTSIIPSITMAGTYAQDSAAVSAGTVLIEPSVTYITFGANTYGSNLTKQTGSASWVAGRITTLFASVPIAGLSASTTATTTIPLTSSVLVTQPDFDLEVQGANGFGSTNTLTRRFSNIITSIGSSARYTDSTTLGGSVTITEAGTYNIVFIDSGNSTTDLHVRINNVIRSLETAASTNVRGQAVFNGYLNVNDVVTFTRDAASAGSQTQDTRFIITKVGATSILNPSTDQKVVIPTHQLRFEGASSRGSTDTAIVKFDTQAITQGDGFTVVNTAANGTVVTVLKAGKLTVSTNVLSVTAGTSMVISKNQSTLTTLPSNNEVMALGITSGGNDNVAMTAVIDVIAGDKIRVASNNTISNAALNLFTLSLQEQSVAVALQNVTPTYDNSDSAVRLTTGNGFGSSSTTVRRFSNTTDNFGTDITYADSASAGASFTINKDGIYNFEYADQITTTSNFFITKNSTTQNTSAILLASQAYSGSGGTFTTIAGSAYLVKGDVVRCGSDGPAGVISASTVAYFTISRVGKTSGTVDVTPFVQIPQQMVEEIHLKGSAGYGSSATKIPYYTTLSKNSNTGIIQVLTNDSTNGLQLKALKDCNIYIKASASFTVGSNIGISKNSTQLTTNVSAITSSDLLAMEITAGAGFTSEPVYMGKLVAGDILRPHTDGSAFANGSYNTVSLLAEAISPSIATPTQQISSDTLSFVFKSTAIDPNTDAIGTFNTYTYAANTNTATIAGTAPTQTTSSMNIDGVRVFARAYNAASTAASPARVDVFIGKGLKSKQVDLYANAAKTTAMPYDRTWGASNSEFGSTANYNETTGILTIDCGINLTSATTSKYVDTNTVATTSGYFVFNASKTPSLTTVPQLQQRVAYLSEQQAIGAGGGTSVAATWTTRTLNTLVDDTGIITSLSTNQFTLPAGTYDFRFSGPLAQGAAGQTAHRIRNISDGVTVAVAQAYNAGTAATDIISGGNGRVVITSAKTFALQYFVTNSLASFGLGQNGNSGDTQTFGQVRITKIK